jgi:type II secretion system protein I
MRGKRKAESGKPRAESGFSLLEVILALAILTGALVLLGEFARLGAENAGMAQNLSQAQLICESKLAEIVSGETQPESDSGSPEPPTGDDDDMSQWNYTVDVEPVANQSVQNLLAVTVTVTQDLPKESHPVSCVLTRWITDPNATYTTSSSSSSMSGSN